MTPNPPPWSLERVLYEAGTVCITIAGLLVGLWAAGAPIRHWWIAAALLALGLAAFVWLGMRTGRLSGTLGKAAVVGVVGSLAGVLVLAGARAVSTGSWGTALLVIAASALVGGVSLWLRNRDS